MRYLLGFIGVLFITMTFTRCETDFELNAPYEKTAVIFGFLEISADTQYFRIQKTFLGEGDALLFAQNEDSAKFDNVEGRIFWTNEFGTQGSANMDTITITNKETDGAFFAPDQLVYYIPSEDIEFNTNYTYHLDVTADGETYSATTKLVEMEEQDIQQPPPDNAGVEIAMVTGTGANVNYIQKKLRFTTAENARRYELLLKYHYVDHRPEGVFPRTYDFKIGDVTVNSDNGGSIEEREFNSESWYALIGAVNDFDPDLIYREAGQLDWIITLAAEDLHNYIAVNEPVTGIVQNRPEYTNINKESGGSGIGVFSSRYRITRTKFLNFNSMKEMVCGQYTEEDKFCDPSTGSLQCGTSFTCD